MNFKLSLKPKKEIFMQVSLFSISLGLSYEKLFHKITLTEENLFTSERDEIERHKLQNRILSRLHFLYCR